MKNQPIGDLYRILLCRRKDRELNNLVSLFRKNRKKKMRKYKKERRKLREKGSRKERKNNKSCKERENNKRPNYNKTLQLMDQLHDSVMTIKKYFIDIDH